VSRLRLTERLSAATLVGTGAIILGLAVALPLVWWQPLSVDEATTLEYATRRITAIAHDTFVDRGGGPLYFGGRAASKGCGSPRSLSSCRPSSPPGS
jgi:hypothetical protein